MDNAFAALQNPQPSSALTKAALVLQLVSGTICFLLTPIVFLSIHKERMLFEINSKEWSGPKLILLPALCAIGFLALLPVSEQLYLLSNQFFQNFELFGLSEYVIEKDQSQETLISVMTNFDTTLNFALALLAITVIAPIGEELLFRGIVQNLLLKLKMKPWSAILVSALIFSIIHFNFNGFLSRFVLGAALGLAYYKSGNILVPILGHFTNNFVTILISYLAQHNIIEPKWVADQIFSPVDVGISILIACAIYWIFSNQTNEYTPRISNESLGKDILK